MKKIIVLLVLLVLLWILGKRQMRTISFEEAMERSRTK